MTEIEIIAGLLSALSRCRKCSQPATHYTASAEIGYYLDYCSDCEKRLPTELGVTADGEKIQSRKLKIASVIREAQRILKEHS